MARKARTWKGARTPQALKRVRQSLRRRSINQRTRSHAKTLVVQASSIALGRSEGDGGILTLFTLSHSRALLPETSRSISEVSVSAQAVSPANKQAKPVFTRCRQQTAGPVVPKPLEAE